MKFKAHVSKVVSRTGDYVDSAQLYARLLVPAARHRVRQIAGNTARRVFGRFLPSEHAEDRGDKSEHS